MRLVLGKYIVGHFLMSCESELTKTFISKMKTIVIRSLL